MGLELSVGMGSLVRMSTDGGFQGSGGERPPGAGVRAGLAAMIALAGTSDQAVAEYGRGLGDFDLVGVLPDSELVAAQMFATRLRLIQILFQRPVMNPSQPSPDDPTGQGATARKGRRRRGLSRDD
jgi:hypothetical protein